MTDLKKQLNNLYETGIYYAGSQKKVLGKVEQTDLQKNACGYFQNTDGSWVIFVTDKDRDTVIEQRRYDSEQRAVLELLRLAERQNRKRKGMLSKARDRR